MTVRKSRIPMSKAKTAYGLLSEIRRLILEEPKRYDQRGYLCRGYTGWDAPACGTVGCVAGWVNVLRGDATEGAVNGIDRAAAILGLGENDTMWKLFDHDKAGERGNTARGRRAHAKRGAAHIARFQRKHAAQLKAKRL